MTNGGVFFSADTELLAQALSLGWCSDTFPVNAGGSI